MVYYQKPSILGNYYVNYLLVNRDLHSPFSLKDIKVVQLLFQRNMHLILEQKFPCVYCVWVCNMRCTCSNLSFCYGQSPLFPKIKVRKYPHQRQPLSEILSRFVFLFFLNVASVWPKSRNERKSSYFYINSCRELSQDTNIIHTSVCKLALQLRKVEPHLLWIQSNEIAMENLLAQLPEEII